MSNKRLDKSQLLDSSVTEYYDQQSISSERLDRILEESPSGRRKKYLGLAIAASLLMMVAGLFTHQARLNTQRTDLVLKEIALNHVSKLQMDAKAETLTDLQTKLSQLPFEIKLPQGELYSQLVPVGGRLCTINGKLAAHVKLRNPSNEENISIFLTEYAPKLESMNNLEKVISGVEVKLWREDAYVYAFVK